MGVREVLPRLVPRPVAGGAKEDELPECSLIHRVPACLVGDVEEHPKCCPTIGCGLGWLGEKEVAQHRAVLRVGGTQPAEACDTRVLANVLNRHGGCVEVEVVPVVRRS